MRLQVHSLLQWQDTQAQPRVERVLFLDQQSDVVMTIDISDRHALPRAQALSELEQSVTDAEAIVLGRDPYSWLRKPDDTFQDNYGPTRWEKYCARRDERWAVIEPIVVELQDKPFDSRQLGPLVQQAHQRTGKSRSHIYEYLRCYWQRGACRNALLPLYARCGFSKQTHQPDQAKWGRRSRNRVIPGAAPGINVDEAIREKFRRGTKLFYEKRGRSSLTYAYNKILARYFNAGYAFEGGERIPVLLPPEERPTLRQYRYWYNTEWDPIRTGIAREGIRRFNLIHRAVLGDYRSSLGLLAPGSLVQYDPTICDVNLVSEIEREIIGRPVLSLFADVATQLIPGFSVGLEGPSWASAMLAVENMTLDKVEYCAELGITIKESDWPSHHLPRRICGDRGEILSKASDKLVSAFDIAVSNTAAYRPDWKGLIERDFRLINEGCIQWIPGHTEGRTERGERDSRLDACMTLREFTQYIAEFILEYNTTHQVPDELLLPAMIRDGVEPYPNELWQWGVENLSGALRTEPRAVVQRNLLPSATASVARDGIHFGRLHYMCKRAYEEHWVERARAHGSWTVPILFDPRTPKRIFLDLEKDAEPELCALTDQDARFATCTWADVQYHFARGQMKDQERDERTRPEHIRYDARREARIEEAERKTREAKRSRGPQSKAEQIAGIRQNRQIERQIDHEERAWLLGIEETQSESPLEDAISSAPAEVAVAESTYLTKTLAMLSRASDAAFITSPTSQNPTSSSARSSAAGSTHRHAHGGAEGAVQTLIATEEE